MKIDYSEKFKKHEKGPNRQRDRWRTEQKQEVEDELRISQWKEEERNKTEQRRIVNQAVSL